MSKPNNRLFITKEMQESLSKKMEMIILEEIILEAVDEMIDEMDSYPDAEWIINKIKKNI